MKRKAPRLPLEGYRVVELAHHLAGPLVGMHLADTRAILKELRYSSREITRLLAAKTVRA